MVRDRFATRVGTNVPSKRSANGLGQALLVHLDLLLALDALLVDPDLLLALAQLALLGAEPVDFLLRRRGLRRIVGLREVIDRLVRPARQRIELTLQRDQRVRQLVELVPHLALLGDRDPGTLLRLFG